MIKCGYYKHIDLCASTDVKGCLCLVWYNSKNQQRKKDKTLTQLEKRRYLRQQHRKRVSKFNNKNCCQMKRGIYRQLIL